MKIQDIFFLLLLTILVIKKYLTDAVTKILSDTNLYTRLRKNAISLAKEYEWGRIFNEAFDKLS